MKRALFAGGLLLCFALLSSTTALAQTGSARGKVVDEKGQAIPEAKVTIEFQGGVTRKYETKTNKRGEFIQVGMPPGTYKFTAFKEGLQGTFIETRVQLGDATQIPDMVLKVPAAGAGAAGGTGDQIRTQFKQAIDLTTAGKLDEAEATYKAIIAIDPQISEVYQNLGYVYSQKKDWAAAEGAYLKAMELKPGNSDLASALARIYQESGQSDKATALMAKTAGENPADAKAQFNAGIFALNSGKSEEAIAAFQKAVAADPTLGEANYYLGTLMVGQNKVADAVQYLEKYLAMSPTNAQNKATAEGLLAALKPKK